MQIREMRAKNHASIAPSSILNFEKVDASELVEVLKIFTDDIAKTISTKYSEIYESIEYGGFDMTYFLEKVLPVIRLRYNNKDDFLPDIITIICWGVLRGTTISSLNLSKSRDQNKASVLMIDACKRLNMVSGYAPASSLQKTSMTVSRVMAAFPHIVKQVIILSNKTPIAYNVSYGLKKEYCFPGAGALFPKINDFYERDDFLNQRLGYLAWSLAFSEIVSPGREADKERAVTFFMLANNHPKVSNALRTLKASDLAPIV